MEWQHDANDNNALRTSSSSNPWLSASSVASTSRSSAEHTGFNTIGQGSSSVASSSNGYQDPLVPKASRSGHRKYRTTDDALGLGLNGKDAVAEMTRPSLNRLTSNGLGGLLHGLDRLGLRSNNASTDSISTQDDSHTGSRRSLDEMRRLSIKGKSRASQEGDAWEEHLGQHSLQSEGREALLHGVEKGDTLVGMALLYGCTAQAIRAANKLWLNDSIHLRKTLFIPLDACTQPPSREVEFVQKPGEDAVHLYFRTPTPSGRGSDGLRTVKSSYGLKRGETKNPAHGFPFTPYHDVTPDERSPFSSTRSSFSQPSGSGQAIAAYLSSTNSEYASSSEYLSSGVSESSSHGTSPASAGIPLADDPLSPPSSMLTKKRTVQIVRMPGPQSQPKSKGKVPLLEVDSTRIPEAGEGPSLGKRRASRDTIVATSSASLLTPSNSSDRLSSLVPGLNNPANLRLRPRSPWEGAAETPNATTEFPEIGASARSSMEGSLIIPSSPAFPPRKRKISKESVPQSSPAASSSTGSAVGYLATAVGSLLNGSKSGSTGKKWLAMDEFEDEMELARAYQDSRTRRVSQTLPSKRNDQQARTRVQDVFRQPGVS